MSKIFLCVFVTLLIVGFVQCETKKRRLEILPSVMSPPEFVKQIIEVDEEYIQKNLVGRQDMTFIDITDEEDTQIKSIPFEVNYPAPRRQSLLKPLLEKAS